MARKKPLFQQTLRILRKPQKGGWCYLVITGIPESARGAGGLVRVCGSVDSWELRQFNLLPMKDGNYMLVLKAQVRKVIGKKTGDKVEVVLYPDNSAVKVPEEIAESLEQSPTAAAFFETLSESNKKYYIDWIAEARQTETRVTRILKMIRMLEHKKRFWDWPSGGI